MSIKEILMLALIVTSIEVSAQFYKKIPSFEVSLKAGYMNGSDTYPDPVSRNKFYRQFEGVHVQGELNFHIGQHIAIGYFQNRSVFGDYRSTGENSNEQFDYEAEYLIHGLNLRLSTGRSAKFRPYIQAKYYNGQFVVDYGEFRVAREGPGVAGGFGLMMRIGHKVYINLIEADVSMLRTKSDVLLMEDPQLLFSARTGVTYNFSKRK